MSVKKEYQSEVKKTLKQFGMPRNVGSATKDGAVEGISVNTQAELSGADVRTLAELTAKVPNQLSIKRSGKGVRILVS